MSDPDRAPQPVEDAAFAAAQQIQRVWELAFIQGVREGMEAAAKVCEAVAVTTRQKPEGVHETDIPAIAASEFLRDQIRQFALAVEDPPVAERNPPTEGKEPPLMKAPPKIGDRIRLTAPVSDKYPPPGLLAGEEGTVDWVGQWTNEYTRQVGVKWDNGRRLVLVDGDQFEVIS